MEPQVYSEALKSWAERTPDSPAILAPGKTALTYAGLWNSIEQTARMLRSMGIGRNDRVATVLPKCAQTVVLHLGISACATCVPLNPASREAEIDYVVSALSPKCIVVSSDEDPAASVARARQIGIARPGRFQQHGDEGARPPGIDFAGPDDIALILQTSGTTSRPKLVPYRQRAYYRGMKQWAERMQYSPRTCSLNATPLFHLHGVATAIMPLVCGARVVSTSGFDPDEFFAWLDEFRLNRVSLVPTMLQAILAAAPKYAEILARASLEGIFSSAASLHPKVIADLECLFRAPLIEQYGLTEVSGGVLGNPMPPGKRKTGSVGVPSHQQVAVLDDAGQLLGPGEQGDIAVRGPCVMEGYLGDPESTAAAFRNGWLLTGDRGYRDEDGYHYITGRTKEIINRGGEKISPREVDDVLMTHPAVRQAVTFAVPHATLGEDVAAAVVPAPDTAVTSRELRSFAAARLAQHKVPRRILLVDDLPKGSTGKVQRIGMAARLNIQTRDSVYTAPRNSLETALVGIWTEVLGIERIGIHDDFFEIGGDSLLAVRMLDRVEQTTGRKISIESLFDGATVERLAAAFLSQGEDSVRRLVAVWPSGSRPPLFLMHGDLVGGGTYAIQLARHLGPDQPLYMLNPHMTNERKLLPAIPEMAAENVADVLEVDANGPFYLAGFCNGALVAYEMALRLRRMGKQVAMLVMLDAPFAGKKLRALTQRFSNLFAPAQIPEELLAAAPLLEESQRWRLEMFKAYVRVIADYDPQPFDGKVTLLWTAEWKRNDPANPTRGWGTVAPSAEVRSVPGNHAEAVTKYADVLAAAITQAIQPARRHDVGQAILPAAAS